MKYLLWCWGMAGLSGLIIYQCTVSTTEFPYLGAPLAGVCIAQSITSLVFFMKSSISMEF